MGSIFVNLSKTTLIFGGIWLIAGIVVYACTGKKR
jgi:hypothetical protein